MRAFLFFCLLLTGMRVVSGEREVERTMESNEANLRVCE